MAQATDATTIMSKEEAFGDLARQGLAGPVNTTARELARRWGLPDDDAGRMRVQRMLKAWQEQGLINREVGTDGRQTITIGTVNVQVNNTVNIGAVQPDPATVPAPEPASQAERPSFTLPLPGVHHLLAVTIAATGLYIAGMDGLVSANYGRSLGRTPEAAALFTGIAWAVTAAGLVLPTAAMALWRGGRRGSAFVAWSVVAVLIVPMAALAALGFVAENVSDRGAERGKAAREAAMLQGRIEQLIRERQAIVETRSAAAIEAEVQAAQAQAGNYFARTKGCTDVTQPKSGEACAPVLDLRRALGEARRRDAVDLEVKERQTQLAALPALSSADPQAEGAAGFVTWVSLQHLTPAASDFAMLRLGLFAAVLLLPGVLEMLAASLWGLKVRND